MRVYKYTYICTYLCKAAVHLALCLMIDFVEVVLYLQLMSPHLQTYAGLNSCNT